MTESDVEVGDGRSLHVYDTGGEVSDNRLVVFWHHGTPNLGVPPEPLFPVAERLGMRWVSYDRPGYAESTPNPGRDVASAAADVARVADARGINQFAVMGHSGGAPHALACAALMPERVIAAVCVSGTAPFEAEGLDWYAGMAPSGEAELRSAVAGRSELESYFAANEFDPEIFTPSDHAALAGEWSWLGRVAMQATKNGTPRGMVDDNLAYVGRWGFEPGQVSRPVLILHGGQDRVVPSSHGKWLASRVRPAELWLRQDDGHISILSSGAAALGWLRERI
ncbi:MAG: alpha/beta hydrolase [Chloroflexi bacterium]|nr:MAG: alpha/beta hydrolase [Chloroflexota bacterium]